MSNLSRAWHSDRRRRTRPATRRAVAAAAAATLVLAAQPAAAQTNVVHGELFSLTTPGTGAPAGGWSWFQGERAIVDDRDPDNPLLIASSASSVLGFNRAEDGDVDVLWRNLRTGTQGVFELRDGRTFDEPDDHNSASLSIRPDGRYLAAYAGHDWDDKTYYRVSTHPGDPTSWQPEFNLSNTTVGTVGAPGFQKLVTYNNAYYLPNDDGGNGRYYNFTRSANFNPTIQTSSDGGDTWAERGKLVTQGRNGNARPYARYDSDGERIHVTLTQNHPRDNGNNSIYHGYVQDGRLFGSTGGLIDADVFDFNGVSVPNLTPVFRSGDVVNGNRLQRAWTVDVAVDANANPVTVFQARVDDDRDDHRYLYGRFDGNQWRVNELAKAGGFLYDRESDYTGLVALDPDDPDVLFMSSDVNPLTGEDTERYEIYRGETADLGETWAWTALTENSTVNNIRPVVPEWNDDETAVIWMRGLYGEIGDTTYFFNGFETQVVGLTFAVPEPGTGLLAAALAAPLLQRRRRRHGL